MLRLFGALVARIKALFMADAALEIQSEMLVRNAERKAALLRLAARFEAEGLTTVASQLRQQAEELDLRQSPDGIAPAIESIADESAAQAPAALPAGPTASTSPTTATKVHRSRRRER